LDETSFYVPAEVDNAYFESKYAMEAEIYRYLIRGLPVTIAIPGLVFGPGDIKPNTGAFVLRILKGRMPALVGDVLNVVDVRDVGASVAAALERGRPGRRYILGGTNVEVVELVQKIAVLGGAQAPSRRIEPALVLPVARWFERGARRLGVDGPRLSVDLARMHYARPLNSARSQAELGHTSRPLDQSLEASVAWFKRCGYL
ncbi:MAG: NAD-dependent dehydratase, partial [Bradymonadaceae bacterium]